MGRVCHGPSLLWAEMSRNRSELSIIDSKKFECGEVRFGQIRHRQKDSDQHSCKRPINHCQGKQSENGNLEKCL